MRSGTDRIDRTVAARRTGDGLRVTGGDVAAGDAGGLTVDRDGRGAGDPGAAAVSPAPVHAVRQHDAISSPGANPLINTPRA
ncbi:hypothetical protein AB0K00_43410 [Dactylosporangium sp. NPDC049525]|uniref:hypothetical protein n=1 Tax=Dactylosporangium sp. NPDC049525 TaxID=3154730 RepID=UPI00341F26BC